MHRKRIHGQTETKRRSCIYGEKDQRLRSNWCFLWARVWDALLTWTLCSPVMESMPLIRCPAADSPTTSPSYLEPLKHLQQENSEEQRLGEGLPVAQSRHWAGCQTTVYQKWLRLSSQNDPSKSAKRTMILPSCSHSFFLFNSMPDAHRDHKRALGSLELAWHKTGCESQMWVLNYQVISPGSLYSD